MPRSSSLSENSRVLHPDFLQKHSNKKDLYRRLRKVIQVLQEDESVEAHSEEWPGLASTLALLLQWLDHKDKQVRLLALHAAMELIAIYAPEVPLDNAEVILLFQHVGTQLGNLAHSVDASQPHFATYVEILRLLAEVKMGAILTEVVLQQSHNDDNEDSDYSEEHTPTSALDTLVEFMHTLLNAVRREHPPEVFELVCDSVIVLLEEYHASDADIPIPVGILDELLLAVGQGPTVKLTKLVTHKNPKTQSSATQPQQVPVSNPTHTAATRIIRSQINKLEGPLAQLLNGLLHADPILTAQSSILPTPEEDTSSTTTTNNNNVYTIIYELHHVAPTLLTTILGTLSATLSSTNTLQRAAVTQLLGKLLAKAPALAQQYSACYREWWQRAQDVEPSIRQVIVQYCVQYLKKSSSDPHAHTVLYQTITQDPHKTVRLAAIHQVCELAHQGLLLLLPTNNANNLLTAVGTRIHAKDPAERKDAVTGLAQVYWKQAVWPRLKPLHDEAGLEAVVETVRLNDDERVQGYEWIPGRILESFRFSDARDADMRSRVYQIWDDVLLGSELSSKKKLSPTARAVGLVQLWQSLDDTPSREHLEKLLRQRQNLQQAVSQYIDARSHMQKLKSGTEEALVADAKAMELLESLARMTPMKKNIHQVLSKFHGARDKQIFRILATICDPKHSTKSRIRALDELPKRTQSLGDDVAEWVKTLVKRCAMGSSLNAEVVQHCVLLAQECFRDNDIASSTLFLSVVKLASEVFPQLCAPSETFTTLTELFAECRQVDDKRMAKEIEKSGMVTVLSSVLSAAVSSGKARLKADTDVSTDTLQAQLLQMCTTDGTPEQARNAVHTLAKLVIGNSTELDSTTAVKEGLGPLLTSLTSPSKLKVFAVTEVSTTLVSILASLSALAESAPAIFDSKRGAKSVSFALDTVLMGRGYSTIEDSDGESSSEEEQSSKTPARSKPRGSLSRNHLTPTGESNLLEDETLTVACRRLCAAIEFLVTHIRSVVLQSIVDTGKPSVPEHAQSILAILVQLLQDKGLAPSSHDRQLCSSRQDRAALRQCAAVHILRLCDPRLGFENSSFTPAMWHVLGESFLDEERTVRETVIRELGAYMEGRDSYSISTHQKVPWKPPSLRFMALLVLCSDGDHGSEHDPANGGAANAGKSLGFTKNAALLCVEKLRTSSDATYAQCRTMGKAAEEKFERVFKMMFMPEYSVPFALHLLTHRNETPSASDTHQDGDYEDDEETSISDESRRRRVLRRRLRLLFEMLVQSLGDTADNISFLLRMVELTGKNFRPVDVSLFGSNRSRHSIESPDREQVSKSYRVKRENLLAERLKVICGEAREVLLSFVKKDINLTPYPGQIQMPRSLFRLRSARRAAQPSQASLPDSQDSLNALSLKTQSPVPGTKSPVVASSSKKSTSSRVHFSPDVLNKRGRSVGGSRTPLSQHRAKSPTSERSKSVATLGTTPPSVMRGATMRSTAVDAVSSPVSTSRSSEPRTSLSPVVLEEVRHSSQSSSREGKTTSETQSFSQSQSTKTRGRRLKRGRSSAGGDRSTSRGRSSKTSSVPKQIKINRQSASQNTRSGTKNKRSLQNEDLDFHDGENTRTNRSVKVRRTRKRS